MRRVCPWVALSAIALVASIVPTPGAAAGREARQDAAAAVTALSVVSGAGRADVVVEVSGPVQVQDFTVPSPHRIVLDITGARLAPMAQAYDRLSRGGIVNVRLAQYRTDVVRVVLDLTGAQDYTVSHEGNAVRVSIATASRFAAWHSSGAMLAEQLAAVGPTTSVESPGSVEPEPVRDSGATIDSLVAGDAARSVAVPRAARAKVSLFTDQSQQPRLTVTYSGAEMRDVLAGFASFSGRTIVVGKEIAGTVTAEIKDQPWDVALKAILESHGLAAIEETSGIITVDSYENILKKQSSEPVATQMVNINYVSAQSLLPTVQGLLYKDCAPGASQSAAPAAAGTAAPVPQGCMVRGNVAADSGTNALIITEVASRLSGLLQWVKGLDVRTPQVALKAKIVSVQRSQIEQLGLSYDLGSAGTYFNTLAPRIPEGQSSPANIESQVELGGDAIAGVANAQRIYKNGSALNLIFSTALGKYSLTSFLDALRSSQLSDIQAEPSVVTLDNREAQIVVGQETPVRVIDAGSASQVGQPVRANVQFRETGIILKVTPHITSNRQVRMKIEAEQSELRIVGGDLGFIIDKRNAKTQALVNDGESAVIGGLTQTQVTKNRSGIPFLSDLPLIGRFFSQTDSREEKKDLLIMITPTIIDDGESVRPPENR